jgi:hypothetical protein
MKTLLMVDDTSVMYSAGVQRQLQPLERLQGQALIQPDRPWEQLLAYNTVLKIDGEYRMWYQSCNLAEPSCIVCYATSKDGLKWTKPDLGLFAHAGSNRTNIVLQASAVEGPRPGLYYGDVLHDPADADPSRRFKMVVFDMPLVPGVPHGSGRPGVPGMWLAFSADGIVWERPSFAEGPALVAAYGGSPVTQPPYADRSPVWGLKPSTSSRASLGAATHAFLLRTRASRGQSGVRTSRPARAARGGSGSRPSRPAM